MTNYSVDAVTFDAGNLKEGISWKVLPLTEFYSLFFHKAKIRY